MKRATLRLLLSRTLKIYRERGRVSAFLVLHILLSLVIGMISTVVDALTVGRIGGGGEMYFLYGTSAVVLSGLFIWRFVIGIVLLMVFWDLTPFYFNGRQGKRLFPVLAIGGAVGYSLGSPRGSGTGEGLPGKRVSPSGCAEHDPLWYSQRPDRLHL